MSSFPWFTPAVLTALVFTALAARAAMPDRAHEQAEDGGEDAAGAPLAPLQRVAWWTLGAGVAFVAAVVRAHLLARTAGRHPARIPETLSHG